jgi:Tfp pilus assembly protein PilF
LLGTSVLLLPGCRGAGPLASGPAEYGEVLPPASIGELEGAGSWPNTAGAAAARPLAAVRESGAAILAAITPQPRVTPAADPISLSSAPEKVSGDLHYQAARVYESQNNIPRAIGHYQQALEAAPRDLRAILALARLHDRKSELQRAEELYLQAAQIEPENSSVLNDLGLCLARQWKLEAAQSALSQAIALQPANPRYRNNLATVLIEMGRADEAVETLAAIHLPAVAHYNTAFLLAQRGWVDAATHHLTLALQADPSHQSARALWARLHGAPSPVARQAQRTPLPVRRLPQV